MAQRGESDPLLTRQGEGGAPNYKARVENLKSALRKWVTINEQRSMALQNSADESEKIKVASKVQEKLMGEMTGLIKQSDEKAKEAEDLVRQQKEALDKVEGIGWGSMFAYAIVALLIGGGLIAAWKLGAFKSSPPSPPSPRYIPLPSSSPSPSHSSQPTPTPSPKPKPSPTPPPPASKPSPPPASKPSPPPPASTPAPSPPSTSGFAGFLPSGGGAAVLIETGQRPGSVSPGSMTPEDYKALMPNFGDDFVQDKPSPDLLQVDSKAEHHISNVAQAVRSGKFASQEYEFEFGHDVLTDIAA